MSEIVRQEDIKYVLITHLYMIEPKLGEKADVYFGVTSEDEKKVHVIVLKGWEYAEGLKEGSIVDIPNKNIEEQIKDGITVRMNTQYYFDEFHGVEV